MSPTHLCHSSFPFSSPCSSWAVFPTISRDWDSLKGKEQKTWKGGWEKLLHPHSWRRSCTGVRIWVRRWGVGRGVRTFGWNWHTAFLVLKPSVFVVASVAFDPFPPPAHTHRAETSYSPRPFICGQPQWHRPKPMGFNFWSTLNGTSVL